MERYEHFKIKKKTYKKHLSIVFTDSKSRLSLVFKRENHGINALWFSLFSLKWKDGYYGIIRQNGGRRL